jgi:UDP-2,4-diacetamido-2,4,6-trideoxy-beta-L-altropyranose hydrolase
VKIAFRVDSSFAIGSGHLKRCRTLAKELARRGSEVLFVSREHSGNLNELTRRDGFPVAKLPKPESSKPMKGDIYAQWLGVPEQTDVEQTIGVLGEFRPDWVVVDHYGLTAEWERRVRNAVAKVLAIDDIARQHDADILLDQNYADDHVSRYRGKLHDSCLTLFGPSYALLDEEYRVVAPLHSSAEGPAKRVVVSFGGGDLWNLTPTVIAALTSPLLSHLFIDVVIGGTNPNSEAVKLAAARRPNTRVISSRDSLLELLLTADLAIGAGGASMWERCCLGLPSIVVCVAENQRPACEAMHRAKAIRYIGDAAGINSAMLEAAVIAALADIDALRKEASQSRAMVDGRGVLRVAEALLPSQLTSMRPRMATHSVDAARASVDLVAHELPLTRFSFEWGGGDLLVDCRTDPVIDNGNLTPFLLRIAENYLRDNTSQISSRTEGVCSLPPFLAFSTKCTQGPSGGPTFKIVIASDHDSWINHFIHPLYLSWLTDGHRVQWIHRVTDAQPADMCFFIGCGQIAPLTLLHANKSNLVVHESDLPQGRGWSPLSWQILEGKNSIAVTLMEASPKVDAGRIYFQNRIEFVGTELVGELRAAQAAATIELCRKFVANYPGVLQQGREQTGESTYYKRRRPDDSRVDVEKSIAEQFNLLRVVDNERYPAFFEIKGRKYKLVIKPIQ